MNAFDRELMDTDSPGLDGWFKKAFKKVKSVVKDAGDSVKSVISEANKVRRKVRTAVVPRKLREFENRTGRKVASNKVFRIVASSVATVYGFGYVAEIAFTGMDAYNAKLLRGEQPTLGETKAFTDSLQFMRQMTAADQEKILLTLTPKVQAQARDYLKKAGPLPTVGKVGQEVYSVIPIEQIIAAKRAAYDAGLYTGQTPEIRAAISKQAALGKTPLQIQKMIERSQFFKLTAQLVKNNILQPIIADQYYGSPNAQALSRRDAQQLSQREESSLAPILIPAAAVAAAMVLT